MRILILVFFTITLARADEYHLSCIAPDLKSSLNIGIINQRLVLTYINLEGNKDFPLYSGVVTKKTMAHIKSAKNNLNEINQKLELSWPIEDCRVHQDQMYLIKCSQNAEVAFPKRTKLTANSLTTSITSEQTFSFTYEKLNFSFNLLIGSKNFIISIPFSKERCQISL
jgi:hypothetical protein